MNSPAAAASSISGPRHSTMADDMQVLRTGLDLARASQLTMLRFQLALHKSNRRSAMQALDNLLDIDAEMEGLAATLDRLPARPADIAALSDFIGLQKAAIASEKHALTGGDLRPDPASEWRDDPDLHAQPLLSDDEAENRKRRGGRRWLSVLAIIAVLLAFGCGLLVYLWPTLPITLPSF